MLKKWRPKCDSVPPASYTFLGTSRTLGVAKPRTEAAAGHGAAPVPWVSISFSSRGIVVMPDGNIIDSSSAQPCWARVALEVGETHIDERIID